MKNKKWLKPLIVVVVIIAVIAAAYAGIMSYLSSRSVSISMDDVTATVQALTSYLIPAVVVIVIALVVVIAAFAIKQPVRGLVRMEGLIAIILTLAITVNVICLGPEYSILNNLLGDTYTLSDETIAASEELVEDIADEGIVLLKNENNTLPLTGVTKLNVFGWSSTNPVYGGTGSGSVDESTCVSLLQGLEEAGFELNTTISDFYTAFLDERPTVGMNGQDWTIPEPTIEEYDEAGIFESATEFSDTAIVVIARSGGENADLPTSITDEDTFEYAGGWAGYTGVRYTSYADDVDPSKSYLELSNREIAMLDRVCEEFDNVVVVINSANAMELGFLDEYDSITAAVWIAGPGQTGFRSLGNVLSGEANPSGKLVDTYVYDLLSIPAINYVGSFIYDDSADLVNTATSYGALYASFNNYVESIYVGYKFYETAAEEGLIDYDSTVQYPFGYGLSYTTFDQEITDFQDDGSTITLTVTVTNTGSVAGKDVVEVYYTPPYYNGGIEKSSVNLLDFGKTDLLEPGTSETVTISFNWEDMASYDYSGIKAEGGAYVLEAGDYEISIRSDSHTVIDSRTVSLEDDIIYNDENDGARSTDNVAATNQFDFAAGDVTYLSRTDGFANYAEATAAPTDFTMTETVLNGFYSQNTYDSSEYDDPDAVMPTTGADNGLTIQDMVGLDYDDPLWDDLLDELTVDEMNNLIGTGGYANAKVDSIGLPATIECDGPAAIANNYTGENGTAFNCATMIAATWSKDLAYQRGQMMGQQCNDMNVVGWYGPAMNIHRTAFSGRNFEYYSEDGVLSGWMGANEVAGAKEYGIQCYIKHFALNDSETNRKKMLCTWTNEQAMREVYLKSFEMSVKIGGADNVMTAFNYVGNVWAGSCEELLQTVLRDEWGFVGSTVSDWFNGTTDGNMLADSAIRVGGDKMLSSSGDAKAFATNTDDANTVIAMRNASHNILYSLANSSAMDERNFSTPGWVTTFYGVDVVIGLVVIALEAYAIVRFVKKRKETAAE
ncbi:MAG: glycoside hydrolase family 3 C-terminal domain-containing protein [Clostridiales bacterium]|nr:glycoside hydrolase family 3 C-terminal domain-containing protein [Clostridiales bacterium]